jgi:hypothetical protein
MAKSRKGISRLTLKRLAQECGSRCPFCGQTEVATFEFHHVDGDRSHSDGYNLINVCSSCHSKITAGIIAASDVVAKKAELLRGIARADVEEPAVNMDLRGASVTGDVAQTITKITTRKSIRMMHPPGSIGANLPMKAYVDYLIERYYDYRKDDPRYKMDRPFSYAVIHTSIRRELGARTFFNPESRFDDLARWLQSHVDQTIRGKTNVSRGISNYHSFAEHCRRFQL